MSERDPFVDRIHDLTEPLRQRIEMLEEQTTALRGAADRHVELMQEITKTIAALVGKLTPKL